MNLHVPKSLARGATAVLALFVLLAAPVSADQIDQAIQRGPFTVHFAETDTRIAEQSLVVLEEAVVEYDQWFSLGEEPVTVHIAPSLDAFRRFAPHFLQLNVSGVARPDQGEIYLKSPRLRGVQDDYAGTIRHELLHILLYRNTDTRALPRWLNEGICMMLANEYRWAAPLTVARMYLGNRIIPYHRLDHAFLTPGSDTEFGDAYAQALSMTRALRDHLGDEKFFGVVLATDNMSFADAMREVGGIDPLAFWQMYERSLRKIALVGTMASGSFFGPAAILLIVAFFRKRMSNRRIMARWEEEELAADGVELFNWDDHVEDPEAWNEGQDDDGDPHR